MRRLYAGIDLHSNNTVLVVTDEADTVFYRKRRRNAPGGVLEALAPFQGRLEGIVVESTSYGLILMGVPLVRLGRLQRGEKL